jgi:oligopeptide/dipeptide ABC transporter ATP-binding protein
MSEKFLEVQNLSVHFPITAGLLKRTVGHVHALNDISFELKAGETLGVVGESGCGKSTLGKAILKLVQPTAGKVLYHGKNIFEQNREQELEFRQHAQMIFQDPYASLNARWSVFQILEEPFLIHKNQVPEFKDKNFRRQKILSLMDKVGLPQKVKDRYPYEFSGGQRQRIGIARALTLNPKLLICDEPVSALDVSIQSQILNLLMDLQEELGLSYVFISHDLSVVKHISTRVMVMYLGHIAEIATSKDLYQKAKHPYTQALLKSIPQVGAVKMPLENPLHGEIPSVRNLPSGCPFHTRCPLAEDQCLKVKPEFITKDGHGYSCLLVKE